MNPRPFLALDPSYPIKRLCVLECAVMFRILNSSCYGSRKKNCICRDLFICVVVIVTICTSLFNTSIHDGNSHTVQP